MIVSPGILSLLVQLLMTWRVHAIGDFRALPPPSGFAEKFQQQHREKYHQSPRRFLEEQAPEDGDEADDEMTLIQFCERMADDEAMWGVYCTCTVFSDGVVEYDCADNCLYCENTWDAGADANTDDAISQNITVSPNTSCGNASFISNLTDSSFMGSISGYATSFQYNGAGGRDESISLEYYGCDDNFVCAECRAYVNSEMCNSCAFCDTNNGLSDYGAIEVNCENLAPSSSFNYCQGPPGPGVFQALDYAVVECIEPPPGPPPFNDNCTNATAVAAGDFFSGTLNGARLEIEALPFCPNVETGMSGVWFTFKGTGAPMLVSTCASNEDVFFSENFVTVYQGSECGLLECVDSSFQDANCAGLYYGGTSVSLSTEIGTTYYIYVSDRYGSMGTYDLTLTAFTEPSNDQCPTATEIELDNGPVFGTAERLPDEGELTACGAYFAKDGEAWFQIEAPEDATFRASTCSSSTIGWGTGITIVGGTCDNQACVAESSPFRYLQGCGDNGNIVEFQVAAGELYYVVVWGPLFADLAFYELNIQTLNPPANDDCQNAEMIDVNEPFTGTVTDATKSEDEQVSTCFSGFEELQGGVWYSFVGTGDVFQATSCSNDVGHFISIFSGSCGSLECVAEATYNFPNNDCSGYAYGHRSGAVTTTPGETYYVLVSTSEVGGEGTFDFSMRSFVPAENDKCDGASLILPDGDTIIATTDIAIYDGFLGNCVYSPLSPALWYVVVGTGGQIRADTCSNVTNFDTIINVYRGICGNLNCVGSNDDACSSLSSSIIWESELFVNYYIRVQGLGDGQTGDFGLTVSSFEPAENDQCPGAIELAVGGSYDDSLATATGEGGQIDCTFVSPDEPSLWYYIEGTGSALDLSTCSPSSTVSGRMQIFTGESCLDLNCEPSTVDYSCLNPSVNAKFFAEEGVRYYILFSGYGFGEGAFTLTVTEFETVDNDLCEGAILISDTEEIPIIGSTIDALADSSICGYRESYDYAPGVWYKMIGTGDAMEVSTCSSELTFDSSISVFAGSCGDLACLAYEGYSYGVCDNSFFGSSRTIFQTEAGAEYFILVSGAYSGASGDFGLTIAPAETPSNDLCSDAAVLAADGEMIFGSTINATISFLSDYNCSYAATPGVWYSLMGDGGVYAISTCSSELNFDAAISVTSGGCGKVEECVTSAAFNDFTCLEAPFTAARAIVRTEEGVEYKIMIHGAFVGAKGDFGLTVSEAELPPNDVCSGAISVVPNTGAIFGSTVDATESGATGCFTSGSSPDVWYRVEGTGTTLIASLCSGSTNYDSQIAIYEVFGDDCDTNCLMSNDDFCGVASEVEWFAAANSTYMIQVYGFAESSGDFELTVTGIDSSLDNDQCSDAIVLPTESQVVFGDTRGATNTFRDSCDVASTTSSPDVWYAIEGTGESITLSTCNSGTMFDTMLSVFTGDCDQLECFLSSDDDLSCEASTRSTVSFVGEPRVLYWIRLNGFESSAGEYELSLQVGDNAGSLAPEVDETSDVCETAIEVFLFSDNIGSTANASPDPLLTYCGEATSVVSNGVWYKIEGDGSVFTASTCNAVTNFDTQLSVFTGECTTGMGAVSMASMECVDGNDQFCGDQSQVEWSTVPGVTYYILVHGYLTSFGTFQLSMFSALVEEEDEELIEEAASSPDEINEEDFSDDDDGDNAGDNSNKPDDWRETAKYDWTTLP